MAEAAGVGRRVGVAILTRNEAANLPRSLAAIPPCIPVAIIDSGSTDATLGIAQGHGCRVLHRDWTGFADQRNFALKELAKDLDWIVFIDADEVFPAPIWAWLAHHLDFGLGADVIYLSQRIHIGGRMLRHAPRYPIYHPRVVRTWDDLFVRNLSGHGETVRAGLDTLYLDIPYQHHIIGERLDDWLAKHVKLAMIEAQAWPAPSAGVVTPRARLSSRMKPGPLRAGARFIFHYLIAGGWRDGREGFIYSALYGWYELTKWLVALRLGRTSGGEKAP